jgi:hypothetical protein
VAGKQRYRNGSRSIPRKLNSAKGSNIRDFPAANNTVELLAVTIFMFLLHPNRSGLDFAGSRYVRIKWYRSILKNFLPTKSAAPFCCHAAAKYVYAAFQRAIFL